MERLTLPATLNSLKNIREFVVAAAQPAGLGWKATCRLRLGVDEMATNAIEHGYIDVISEATLCISADIDGKSLKIILEDRGKPYDPHQSPPLEAFDLPLEQRRAGGLGIYLTLQGIDEFFYERIGEWNRMVFIMRKE